MQEDTICQTGIALSTCYLTSRKILLSTSISAQRTSLYYKLLDVLEGSTVDDGWGWCVTVLRNVVQMVVRQKSCLS